MAKFLNKKEQVYDLKLTSYGNYLLSIGKFKPVYYEFYDDNILYDKKYTTSRYNSVEPQNEIHKRIKQDTPYFESLVLFEEVEKNLSEISYQYNDSGELLTMFSSDLSPTLRTPRIDSFQNNQGIGDAFLDGETNMAPAWKIVALEGNISSSKVPVGSDTAIKSFASENTNIPQINIDLNYYKKIVTPMRINRDPNTVEEFVSDTPIFADGNAIRLMTDDALIYTEEVNTMMLTENFDIEVFENIFEPCTHASASIKIAIEPTEDDTILIATTIDERSVGSYIYKFVDSATSDSGNTRYVVIDGIEGSAANLYEKILSTIEDSDATAYDKSYEVSYTTDDDSVVTLMNTVPCSIGNTGIITATAEDTSGTFEITSWNGAQNESHTLNKKMFRNESPQVVDGLMVSPSPLITIAGEINTGSVEYYFDILVDGEVDNETACKGAEVFNKESFYVDLDFECDQVKDFETVFTDIYGRVTEPEICQN